MFDGQVVAITGASGGIGRAIAQMYIDGGAKVAISDRESPDATAEQIGAKSYGCDVTDEAAVQGFIEAVRSDLGPIDVYISNAGVGFPNGPDGSPASGSNKGWDLSWQINVMGSVYAARALMPAWTKRGSGRFAITASAAGLLNEVTTTSYTATKYAAVGFAESLAIAHRQDGINVHCICPQSVRTNMTQGLPHHEHNSDGYLEPSDVAQCLKAAIDNDEFLVLPHGVVKDYMKGKAENYDRYISGLAKVRAKVMGLYQNASKGA